MVCLQPKLSLSTLVPDIAVSKTTDVTLLFPVSVHIKLILCVSHRWVKQENEISKNPQGTALGPKLDLGFKEGQTITLNIGVKTWNN